MTLGEYISKYMDSHGLSQRQFALKCNVTNGYVSMLISGVNPRTGKTLRPTLDTYVKLADGMGIPLNGVQEAGGSNPLTQTKKSRKHSVFGTFSFLDNVRKWHKIEAY